VETNGDKKDKKDIWRHLETKKKFGDKRRQKRHWRQKCEKWKSM